MSMTALAPALLGVAAAVGGYFYARRLTTATLRANAGAARTGERSAASAERTGLLAEGTVAFAERTVALASATGTSAAAGTADMFKDYSTPGTGTIEVLTGIAARERNDVISRMWDYIKRGKMAAEPTESPVQEKSPKRTRSRHKSKSNS